MAIENQTSKTETTAISTAEPLARLAIVAGVFIACGYLFLLVLSVVKRSDIYKANQVISIAVTGLIGGVLAIVAGAAFRGIVRELSMAGSGLLVLILSLALQWQMDVPAATMVICGGKSGILAVGFVLAVLGLSGLYARRQNPESKVIRFTSGAASGIALLLYIVQILVSLSEGQSGSWPMVRVFSSGDALLITYFIIVTLAVLSILVISIVASIKDTVVEALTQGSLIIAHALIWLAAGYSVLSFLLMALQGTGWIGSQILQLVTTIVVGLFPLVGAICLCVTGIGRGFVSVTGWVKENGAATGELNPDKGKGQASKVAPLASELAEATVEDQLRKLKGWREQGLISEEDYEQKRKDLLSRL